MAMTQADIQAHYETEWSTKDQGAREAADLAYSDPIQDAIALPAYEELLADLGMTAPLGRVLDVGSGSGRWIRFFLDRLRPANLVGVDFTSASVDLLRKWHADDGATFHVADITDPALALDGPFDLVNIANVLFHVPEPEKFDAALSNLARLVADDGVIVTTEFLPRTSMRSEWMLVRSRYEFEEAVAQAGLRIVAMREIGFFSNDPMGLDGPDHAVRHHFQAVRAKTRALLTSPMNDASREFITGLLVDVERAALAFARERVATVDLPGQKLVALRRARERVSKEGV